MSEGLTWGDYYAQVARDYRAGDRPWRDKAAANVAKDGDYADFTAFEEWMTDKCGADSLCEGLWDDADTHERIGLYAIISDALNESAALRLQSGEGRE